jgi:hypothetical protein
MAHLTRADFAARKVAGEKNDLRAHPADHSLNLPAPLRRACPRCGAQPGVSCLSKLRDRKLQAPHRERRRRAVA